MTAKKENARVKSATEYALRISDLSGYDLYSVGGSLSKCLELLGEASPCSPGAVSYHKIRRALLATGGAYAEAFNCGGSFFVLTIVADSIERPNHDSENHYNETVSTYQRGKHDAARARYVSDDERTQADSLTFQHPSFYSGFVQAPVVAAVAAVSLDAIVTL